MSKIKQPILTLVGRPNVGKSTLFNRLSINKKAIVHATPGVTRDRKYAPASLGPLEFMVIDTPGLEESNEMALEHRMMQQTCQSILECDIVCLIIDGRDGVTAVDKFFAGLIRKYNKPSLLIVNKSEKKFHFEKEYYDLGFGDPIAISAEHNIGMMGLYEGIDHLLSLQEASISNDIETNIIIDEHPPLAADSDQHSVEDKLFRGQSSTTIKNMNYMNIAIVGRPNAGKSTFINAVIKDNSRLLTGPEAGITRESIEIEWEYQGYRIKLIDTAGLRKKSSITNSLEKLSASDSIHSINFANIVVIVLDANNALEQQDLNIANYAIDQGRCVVVVVNKWDLIKDKGEFKEEFAYKINKSLSEVHGVPVAFISAKNEQNLNTVFDECIKIYDIWNKKIATNKLNSWLNCAITEHPLPLQKTGRRTRIKYMTQIKTRPPTFKLFSNNPELVTDSYQKYLKNSLRDSFGMQGIPIRFIFTKTNNPFTK